MDQNNALDRAIGVTSKLIDSMATEWTEEKHRLYLNTMEASFVKQLHSRGDGSNDLLSWLSRAQIHTKLPRLDPKNQPIAQFKVLHKFERAKSRAENDNESDGLSGNHWIQHFRHVIDQKHEREATSPKQTSPFCSRGVHKVSIGSITEVSDQNFVDAEVERGDEMTRMCRKKRARNAVSQMTDQVVPFVVPASNENSEGHRNKNPMTAENSQI